MAIEGHGWEHDGPGQQIAALTARSLQQVKDVLPLQQPKQMARAASRVVTANFTPLNPATSSHVIY